MDKLQTSLVKVAEVKAPGSRDRDRSYAPTHLRFLCDVAPPSAGGWPGFPTKNDWHLHELTHSRDRRDVESDLGVSRLNEDLLEILTSGPTCILAIHLERFGKRFTKVLE